MVNTESGTKDPAGWKEREMDQIFLLVTILASVGMAVGVSAAGLQLLISFISPKNAVQKQD